MVESKAKPTSKFIGLPLIPPNDPSLLVPQENATTRKIHKSVLAIEQSEGVGARVRRSIGTPKLRNLSPFLMLDHFDVGDGAGFPDHPHRGIETATYMLQGGMEHEDFTGARGVIGAGDLQFMTAGVGVVHSEMPKVNEDGSSNVGLQLWIDLPADLKSCVPRYRDVKGVDVPVDMSQDGKVVVKVISGLTTNGVRSPLELSYTPVWFMDVTIKPGGRFGQRIPRRWNAFAYSLDGKVKFGDEGEEVEVERYHNTVFEREGDRVVAAVSDKAKEDARFVLVAGMPLEQNVVQYGPFVATSPDGVYAALRDYSAFENGFERAKGWESEIGKRMNH